MEKINKKFTLFIVFTSILLFSVFGAVNATAAFANKKKGLPDFLEDLLISSLPDATEAEIDRVRTIWIKQIAQNEAKAVEAKEVLTTYQTKSTLTSWRYMAQYLDQECFGGGVVYSWINMVGTSNLNFARFLTPWINAGASIVGSMSAPAHGFCYIMSKLGPTGQGKNGNYFIVYGNYVSDLNDEDWVDNFIGYGHVTSTEPAMLYIGYSYYNYPYIAVGVTSAMGGLCTYNDVMGDCIYFSG